MTTTNITEAQLAECRAEYALRGWVTCPCCGWVGLTVTKAGKIRKHGRGQTVGNTLGCAGSGVSL